MVAEFVAAQLGIADPSKVKGYGSQLPTKHEHARGPSGVAHKRASTTPATQPRGPREVAVPDGFPNLTGVTFDRAAAWLVERRLLLPGASVVQSPTARPVQ